MGKLLCGCELSPGMCLPPEMIKDHKNHTLQALFLWDLIIRRDATPDQVKARETLMMARIAYQEALDACYPTD